MSDLGTTFSYNLLILTFSFCPINELHELGKVHALRLERIITLRLTYTLVRHFLTGLNALSKSSKQS